MNFIHYIDILWNNQYCFYGTIVFFLLIIITIGSMGWNQSSPSVSAKSNLPFLVLNSNREIISTSSIDNDTMEFLRSFLGAYEFSTQLPNLIFLTEIQTHLFILQEKDEYLIYLIDTIKDHIQCLPIPIKLRQICSNQEYTNNTYDHIKNLSEVRGEYHYLEDRVYSTQIMSNNNCVAEILLINKTAQELQYKMTEYKLLHHMPLAFVVCNTGGKILYTSPYFLKSFRVDNRVIRLLDVFNELRGKFICDSTDFNMIKRDLVNKILNVKDNLKEYITTMNNKELYIETIAQQDYLYIYFSHQDHKTNILRYIIEDLFVRLSTVISDSIILTNEQNNILFSSHFAAPKHSIFNPEDSYWQKSYYQIQPITISKDLKCYWVCNNPDNLFISLRNTIIDTITNVNTIIDNFSNNHSDTLHFYKKNLAFILLNADNKIKIAILLLKNNLPRTTLNIMTVLEDVRKSIDTAIHVKNLTMDIQQNLLCTINEELLHVILAALLLFCFAYQFHKKILTCSIVNSNTAVLTLEIFHDNLGNELHMLLKLLNHHNIIHHMEKNENFKLTIKFKEYKVA